mmetsp:Transcript_17893/g.15643  ORF Transcript_17893/g.15643 Transcript_17893/m.15643 type:complete len:87 (-) Transcript_17893:52-312(-)
MICSDCLDDLIKHDHTNYPLCRKEFRKSNKGKSTIYESHFLTYSGPSWDYDDDLYIDDLSNPGNDDLDFDPYRTDIFDGIYDNDSS